MHPAGGHETQRLSDITPQQWKSGIAAWLGWLFDGLDMHLYTLVATPFVAQLLVVEDQRDAAVGYYGSLIQAAFLVGWALGGGWFGRLGDRLGRARALMLTILTYAVFTGLSFFAQTWWHLMIFRFLAALGIGGEWAVGAALLSETWPRRWGPWIAAVLQSAVNCGVLLAMIAVLALSLVPWPSPSWHYRSVFLVGILPALSVLWIVRSVPEPEEWHAAKARAGRAAPSIRDLFRGAILRTTLLTIAVCSLALTAHWAFMYWSLQHLRNLPELSAWSEPQKTRFLGMALVLLMLTSIAGNFLAGAIARLVGYRRAIAVLCAVYFLSMFWTYHQPRSPWDQFWWLSAMGVSQGVFALFTMYLPPLFPTLLRTTGAGFCYNIGRLAAAGGTVFFGLFAKVGDCRLVMLYAGFLFLPAAVVALLLAEPPQEKPTAA
ncbi:MAG: MFS transporter [Thermoguttaceae bacterium]|jgi:MFS family permease